MNIKWLNINDFTNYKARILALLGRGGYVAVTATYAALALDRTIEATSGTFTITLPTAVGITDKDYIIKNSGAGTITIATTSSQTIDGITTKVMNTQYQSVTVVSNGANWIVV